MFVNILIGCVAVLVVLVVVVSLRPAEFRIERTATMGAPAAAVFGLVNDFHHWLAWSPWEKLDPALQRTYSGKPAGTGAVYAWSGNKQVGEGRMTVTDSRPHELIRIKLEFLKPFAATNTAEFVFQPNGEQTVVTWSMTGHHNFMAKAFGLLMNMDKLIGADFEKGLANLKSAVEAGDNR